jgi:Protein of unknown function (DUF3631)
LQAGPGRRRRAGLPACFLPQEFHADGAILGDDDVIRSSDLVAKLIADPERPWAEWKHRRPLTQKQLAGLLAPFHIISLTVHPPGLPDGKGYRRIDFEEAWAAYCPVRNAPSEQSLHFRSVQTS